MGGIRIPRRGSNVVDELPEEDGPETAEIFNLRGASRFLGASTTAILDLIENDGFPARRIGSRWFFGRRAIVDWINAGRGKADLANAVSASRESSKSDLTKKE